MAADGNGDSGFQHRDGKLLNCPSSEINTNPESQKIVGTTLSPMSMYKSSYGVDLFYGSDWDPLVSLAQNVELKGSSIASHNQIASSPYAVGVLGNQGISSTSHLVQCSSDPTFVGLVPMLPCFGNGSFSEMVSSLCLPEYGQIANAGCPPDHPPIKEGSTQITSTKLRKDTGHGSLLQEDSQISDEGAARSSPSGKKRRRVPDAHSQFNPLQNTDQQKDDSGESPQSPREQDEKKLKTEQNPSVNLRGKVTGKQSNGCSHDGEVSKEEYIHVRARRGQATNSHSLAERVRREKISKRMRFLQDLVPGCNKITGKAVMLDEIINYVQSLQQQVEFLSMKLAAVNPELNIDIERMLSKDILHSRGGSAAILGFSPGTSSSHPHPQVTPQGATPAIQSTYPQLHHMLQIPSMWDDDFQSVFQMGFISNPVLDNPGPNGCMKVDM
ncbi:hypothetical protein HHK36_002785 [Tetracentron sinense]|uniref:BHLH domain-containing protein n=1 Tax=Tetracentron sinense TaxID=13715 RepID=A0A834ZRJ0_TETSI|nr:hypothetical protein HHK36_002785 [Tetracentron sinense]